MKTEFSETMLLVYKGPPSGAPGGLGQLSVPVLVSAQVTISRFVGSRPASGSVLTVQSLLGILSLSLPLPCLCSLSLSQNK